MSLERVLKFGISSKYVCLILPVWVTENSGIKILICLSLNYKMRKIGVKIAGYMDKFK